MSEKQKKLLKIFLTALLAGLLTLGVWILVSRAQQAAQPPAGASSEWKVPESEEVREKVDEITNRVLSGGDYSFSELLYVLDHDSASGEKITDYLVQNGRKLLESASSS